METLEYSPKPRNRYRIVRRALILVLVIAALILCVRMGPSAVAKYHFLNAQRRWLNYQPPPDQIVFLQDERPDFMGLIRNEVQRTTDPNLPHVDWRDEHTLASTPTAAGRPLPEFDNFLTSNGLKLTARRDPMGNPVQPTPVLYCGERRCAGGSRLIRLAYHARGTWRELGRECLTLAADLYDPATPRNPLRNVATGFINFGERPMTPIQTVRLFAGQPDPNDASRFTIRYQLENKSGMIEGRLLPSGDAISLVALDGPLSAEKP